MRGCVLSNIPFGIVVFGTTSFDIAWCVAGKRCAVGGVRGKVARAPPRNSFHGANFLAASIHVNIAHNEPPSKWSEEDQG